MIIQSSSSSRLALAATVLLAAGIGFGIARWTCGSPSAAAPVPKAKAAPQMLDLPDSYLTTMNIVVEPVVAGDLGAEVQAAAIVKAATNSQAIVTSRVSGTLIRIESRLGDQVRAGEVLARLQSGEGAQIAAEKVAAEARAALAASALKRELSLFEQRVTPRQDLEVAQAAAIAAEAEAVRARTAASAAHVSADGLSMAVVSPIAGRITSAPARLGAFVASEMELFRVADPRFAMVEASISAADATRIAAGDSATITTAQGVALSATVDSVTPTVDEQTRSATVVLSLAAGQKSLVPGEVATARIRSRGGSNAGIVLPEDAVQMVDGRPVVFVRTATSFKLQPVAIGARSGGEVLVTSGLEAGHRVATRNAFLLKAEFSKGAGEDEE